MFEAESVSEQDVVADFEPVPNKRKNRARCVSIIICTIIATLVIIFCTVDPTVVEYYPDATLRNTTDVCYRKRRPDKLASADLFTTALGLFGVVLGTLVDRLSLIAEEYHHLRQRYGGNWKRMIDACFSGIYWGPVIALLALTTLILVILIFVTSLPWFELRYLVYIFSGIGVGPLIMHLLNLNTQSEVHISTILEEKGMYVANGLAWSYYFNYLKRALPKFKETTSRPLHHARYKDIKLSLNKLLLLIPLDGYVKDNLKEVDGKIENLFDTGNEQDPFHFPVYRLTVNEHEHKYFAIQVVKEPLRILRQVSTLPEGKNAVVKRQACKDEVKLLYQTLSGILKDDPADQNSRGTCILVPIATLDGLENGGLVRRIMDMVQRSCTQAKSALGFVRQKDGTRSMVNESNSSTLIVGSARTVDIQSLTHEVTINDGQQRKRIDSETTNEQDDERNDKKEKGGKILSVKYKNNTCGGIELKVMILPESLGHREPEVKPFAHEVGYERGSPVWNSSQIVHITDGNKQSVEDEYYSNNE